MPTARSSRHTPDSTPTLPLGLTLLRGPQDRKWPLTCGLTTEIADQGLRVACGARSRVKRADLPVCFRFGLVRRSGAGSGFAPSSPPPCASSTSTPWLRARWMPPCSPCSTRWATTVTSPPSCVPRARYSLSGPAPSCPAFPASQPPRCRCGAEEVEALLRVCNSWRDRFLIVVLWFGGIKGGRSARAAQIRPAPGTGSRRPRLFVPGGPICTWSPGTTRTGHGPSPGTGPCRCAPECCLVMTATSPSGRPAQPTEGCDFVLVNLRHPAPWPCHVRRHRPQVARLAVQARWSGSDRHSSHVPSRDGD